MKELHELEKALGIVFRDASVLKTALTHRSYLNENAEWNLPHNERLEFLGDAVLELVVTEHLYRNYENPEGDLTSFRASLVNSQMLARMADEIGLNDFLLLSRGEAKDVGKARMYILANAFEALIGALYLDQGYDAAKAFIQRTILPRLRDILEKKLYRDAKSYFQERAQDIVGITPTYQVQKEEGPDHDKHFVIGVLLGDELVAEGAGSSKQDAQQQAAENALRIKGWG